MLKSGIHEIFRLMNFVKRFSGKKRLPPKGPRYILVTPVRNEERFIGKVLEVVVNQTVLPQKWIIVNDGSTDGTVRIIREYTMRYPFIHLHDGDHKGEGGYSSRTSAVVQGMAEIGEEEHDFVGVLDADLTFGRDYYERILREFNRDETLGVAGGMVYDVYSGGLDTTRITALDHVPGGVQLFRKACYQAIEGYRPLPWGGDDVVAETMAKMKGWKVRSFPNIQVLHHRGTGRKNTLLWKNWFQIGLKDYSLGYHPIYTAFKCLRRIFKRPLFLGSLLLWLGYWYGGIRFRNRLVPLDFVDYLRKQQRARLKSRFFSPW